MCCRSSFATACNLSLSYACRCPSVYSPSCCEQAKDLDFISWTRRTLESGCYTEMSDMEQIGALMHSWATASGRQMPRPARSLMERLKGKSLSAHDAALDAWFK